MTRLLPFDLRALHTALASARMERGLSWTEVLAQINRAFEGTPSIPISLGTLREMDRKSSVTSAVVLQALRWLGRTPESFLVSAGQQPYSGPAQLLPEPGPGRILRFDTRALHAALDARRTEDGLSWKQLAAQLPGFTPAMLTNLATGPLIGFPRVMLPTQWLQQPAAHFVRICTR